MTEQMSKLLAEGLEEGESRALANEGLEEGESRALANEFALLRRAAAKLPEGSEGYDRARGILKKVAGVTSATSSFTPAQAIEALVNLSFAGSFASLTDPAGKKLDALIQKLYSKHGNGVQVDIFDLSKISNAGKTAYETGGEEAADKAIADAIAKYRKN